MTPGFGRAAIVGAVLLCPSPIGSAQPSGGVAALTAEPSVRRALDIARRLEPRTIDDQIRLCEVPAPPFNEAARAAVYSNAMRQAGLANVRIDAEGNVLGERRGRGERPHLVLSAHLDTVFPSGTPTRVTREGNLLRGPGIVDDCRGLAVVLAVARILREAGVSTDGPITFVGTVGEEGLGDLRGVKRLFGETLKGRVDRFVSVEGDGHAVITSGVGSRRYRVTFRGPGGHSYDDFGRASPINAVGLAAAAISRLEVPSASRTTFGIGRIGGGTSINAIATEAWMEVDLRSSDENDLASLEARVRSAVREALEEENERRRRDEPLAVTIERVGSRPAGRTGVDTQTVRTVIGALRALALPVRLEEGSTDANLPMSLGVPAIAVGGGGAGRDAHSPRESFDTTDSWRGTQLVTLLAVALAG